MVHERKDGRKDLADEARTPPGQPHPQRCDKYSFCSLVRDISRTTVKGGNDGILLPCESSMTLGKVECPCASHTTPASNPAIIEAWAIMGPDIRLDLISLTQNGCIQAFCNLYCEGDTDSWDRYYEKGYRCISVRITPMEEEKR